MIFLPRFSRLLEAQVLLSTEPSPAHPEPQQPNHMGHRPLRASGREGLTFRFSVREDAREVVADCVRRARPAAETGDAVLQGRARCPAGGGQHTALTASSFRGGLGRRATLPRDSLPLGAALALSEGGAKALPPEPETGHPQ